MRIIQYGESILRTRGKPVVDFGPSLAKLAEEMVETMYEAEGIGLAAQQIGLALQLCVVDVRPEPGERAPFFYEYDGKQPPLDLIMPLALANPKVTLLEPESRGVYEEGCLSFPGIRVNVERPLAVDVAFKDVGGAGHRLRCDGLLARCILHEVDHLNGVLFIDHGSTAELRKLKGRLERMKREASAD